ncbi:DnaB-like helicase N-terminal domain-containing protein [Streptomyces sp. CBMA123]|uniref:DnaB-like helicase N-terminal domain-containing protein n=1 Tax=Streptomyces sp. CBMA123 TaxID=1896313 RepID=UPI001661EC2F|nr:DnaB-like helicase N-terminal domain-containing protein [Streptomyces sp. CBMA123]
MTPVNRDMSPQLEAEQAVLGACLLDPAQLTLLKEWLEPRHFYRPAHESFFAILLAQHTAGHPALALAPDADAEAKADWAITAITTATREVPGFSASYGHTLVAACPRPAHAAAYGRMVLETAVRRALEEHAHRLLHAAETEAVEAAVELTGALHTVIARLADAWGTIDQRSPRPLPTPPTRPAAAKAAEAARHNEQMLLSSLISSPEQIPQTASWLTAEDLVDTGHRAVFNAMAALAHRREPVDELTVLWEVQRRGALAAGVITVAEVRDLCAEGFPGDPGYWAERVLRAALLRAAATSAGIVRVMALDASIAAGPLLGSAVRALAPADRVQERLRSATAPPTERTGPVVLGTARRKGAALSRSPAPPPSPAARPADRTGETTVRSRR